jgi:hypothetical protein
VRRLQLQRPLNVRSVLAHSSPNSLIPFLTGKTLFTKPPAPKQEDIKAMDIWSAKVNSHPSVMAINALFDSWVHMWMKGQQIPSKDESELHTTAREGYDLFVRGMQNAGAQVG